MTKMSETPSFPEFLDLSTLKVFYFLFHQKNKKQRKIGRKDTCTSVLCSMESMEMSGTFLFLNLFRTKIDSKIEKNLFSRIKYKIDSTVGTVYWKIPIDPKIDSAVGFPPWESPDIEK
jgi:hypothetical protein